LHCFISLLSVRWRVQFLCSAFYYFHFLQVLHPWHVASNESATGNRSTQQHGGLQGSPPHICFLHSVILLYLLLERGSSLKYPNLHYSSIVPSTLPKPTPCSPHASTPPKCILHHLSTPLKHTVHLPSTQHT